jgi:hypothetical protein
VHHNKNTTTLTNEEKYLQSEIILKFLLEITNLLRVIPGSHLIAQNNSIGETFFLLISPPMTKN